MVQTIRETESYHVKKIIGGRVSKEETINIKCSRKLEGGNIYIIKKVQWIKELRRYQCTLKEVDNQDEECRKNRNLVDTLSFQKFWVMEREKRW